MSGFPELLLMRARIIRIPNAIGQGLGYGITASMRVALGISKSIPCLLEIVDRSAWLLVGSLEVS